MNTDHRKPKTENRKPKTENRKPKTENRKPKRESGMRRDLVTIPNLLSSLRIVLMPVLLLCAWRQMQLAFLALLAVCLVSDALDGFAARWLNQQSDFGAKLDSWGDLLTYGAMIAGLYLAWPAAFHREALFITLGVGFYLLPTVASLIKFGELPSYHTWGAKLAALLLAPAYFLLTLADHSLLFRAVIFFHVWVALEGLLIVLTLSRNHYNVPTLFHARTLSRRARESLARQRVKLQARRLRIVERRQARQKKE